MSLSFVSRLVSEMNQCVVQIVNLIPNLLNDRKVIMTYANGGKLRFPQVRKIARCACNINISAYIRYIPMYCILSSKLRPKLETVSVLTYKLTNKERCRLLSVIIGSEQ